MNMNNSPGAARSSNQLISHGEMAKLETLRKIQSKFSKLFGQF